ncbi:MAG TPA: trypsin-like peptidase domain-containing protein [Steroidobacteraceae bacterium]|jgi:serine protease Do/serine protease DegQ|nr:trypsin-like peptidase domain-containing protein [Steroidobacteraceae bacterium]
MNPRDLACTALLAAVVGGIPFAPASAAIPAAITGMRVPSLAPMIRKVSPAVVTIATRGVMPDSDGDETRDDPFYNRFFHDLPGQRPDEQPFAAAGSGVIVDARHGYILTNAHVVDHATSITVTLQDGRSLKAKVVGADPPSDIAVVKVEAHGLAQIRFGDSSRLAVGDFVVAIGNPFGLPHSVTSGIVSGLKRTGFSPDDFENYIQTDASINPGNSGGALVDLNGYLVGINTAILSASGDNIGIGFAIPGNTARRVMSQLIEYGAVDRGQLGLNIYAVTPEVARSLGLHKAAGGLVEQVISGSPADKAGVRAGDVVTAIAGHKIKSNTDLRGAIGLLRVGDRVTIDLLRDGRREQRRAILANTMAAAPEPGHRH